MITFGEVMEFTRNISSHTAFDDDECKALYDLCCQVRPYGSVMEIGCQLGRTSSIIAQVGKAIPYNCIYVDPYLEDMGYLPIWISMMRQIGTDFTLHCMKSQDIPLSTDVDLILIDGDHSFEIVKDDCEIADTLVAAGYVAVHDYGRDSLPDVYRAVNTKVLELGWIPVGVYGTLGVWRI